MNALKTFVEIAQDRVAKLQAVADAARAMLDYCQPYMASYTWAKHAMALRDALDALDAAGNEE